ncbi:hypothetical protein Tco_0010181 [Tanacetum coccineum]
MSSLLPRILDQERYLTSSEVDLIWGRGGGYPDDGASDLVGESMKGGGNGREWEVTEQWVRHPQHMADPQQQSHHQHDLGLEHNLAKVVPALAPQGQERNRERVGPEERPPHMGPLESRAAQGT